MLFAVALVSCDHQEAVETAPAAAVSLSDEKSEVMTEVTKMDAGLEGMVDEARADLLARLRQQGREAADIELLRAERVSWRSTALGCPRPDRMYGMALTPGVLIVFSTGGVEFEYHGSLDGSPFLCEPPGEIETPAPGQHSLDPT